MNHNCDKCKHINLKWCQICDVVYCSCGKEWGTLVRTPIAAFTTGGDFGTTATGTGTVIFHTHQKVAQTK